jgi:hypothetical protein
MSKAKIDIVTAMAEAYGRCLSEPAAKLYVMALNGISDAEASRAAAIAIQRSKFFPAASELLELARTGGVSYEAQAELAFEELNAALYANKPSLMSPLVTAVVNQLGGFTTLRDLPLDEFNRWKRREFTTVYATLLRENPERVAALAGPRSELGTALGERLRLKKPDTAAIEDKNRKLMENLT